MALYRNRILLIFVVGLTHSTLFSQTERDLGLIYSKFIGNGLTLEYRHMIGEKYRMRTGVFFQNDNFYGYNNSSTFVSASDSAITQSYQVSAKNDVGLRFGFLDQLGESVFSLGLDFNVSYRKHLQGNYLQTTNLDTNGTWMVDYTTTFHPLENPAGKYITRHFLVPMLRFAINADIPLGSSMLVHFEMAYGLGAPIYMGASNVQNINAENVGLPPSMMEVNSSVGLGLRYKLGSR